MNPDFPKSWVRNFRAWWYQILPPILPTWHLKRRAGYERRWGLETAGFTKEGFVRILQQHLLVGIRPGLWVELQAGDGLVGSLGVWLEQVEGWKVAAWEHREWPARSFRKNRPSTPFHQERLPSWTEPGTLQEPVGVTTRGVREAAGLCRAIRKSLIRPSLVGIWNPKRHSLWERRLRREGYRLELVWHNVEFYRSRRAEDGRRKTEDGRRKADGRRRESVVGCL